MATNWTVLTGTDLWKVISVSVAKKSNEVIAPASEALGYTETDPIFDAALANRCDSLLAFGVEECRAAIRFAGRNPLSLTPNTIPPEAEVHVLNWAAYKLVTSTPSLQMVLVTADGHVSNPFVTFYKEAVAYFTALRTGGQVTPPSDPAGRDYATAPSATNLAVSALRWGDERGTEAEYDAGLDSQGEYLDPQTMTTN